jgi:hypothetical protein
VLKSSQEWWMVFLRSPGLNDPDLLHLHRHDPHYLHDVGANRIPVTISRVDVPGK